MNLQCATEKAEGYRSPCQIARVVTENWCERELYCPACDSNRLVSSPRNTSAVDFECVRCTQTFQLKSRKRWSNTRIVDAGYFAMVQAIRAGKTPNLLVMQYSANWSVLNLLLIPSYLFSETAIQRRPPLGPNARRAGWIGCNILLDHIPDLGKISVVSSGVAVPKAEVRAAFGRTRPLSSVAPTKRGWTLDVLNVVRSLRKAQFSLSDVYAKEEWFRSAYPDNNNVRPKIRQQLQLLRDFGFIRFLDRGEYALV